jgi:hypothetical protein
MTKRYQRGKLSIEEVQTTSWPKATKEVSSVLIRLTAYHFGIFWSWCCLYFFDWQLTPLVAFGHDVVCTSSIDGLPLWYLLVMMLSVLLRLTTYPFGIYWSWCCLYFSDVNRRSTDNIMTKSYQRGKPSIEEVQTTSWPKATKGVSCQSKKYRQPLWYPLVMMLSVLLRLTAYPFGILWSWWCLYFFHWRLTRGKPSIAEVQTTSWPINTKGICRQSQKYRQHHDQK